VLVQTNYGGVLSVAGVPVGQALGKYMLKNELAAAAGDGSVIIVVATDAPLSDRNLKRLARRTFLGIARTGSPITGGSGDYAVAFSTNETVRRTAARRSAVASIEELPNDRMTPLFQAVVEATEEAVLNSMFKAETTRSNGATVEALPVERVVELYRRARR
jgi:D-aminopeptidase